MEAKERAVRVQDALAVFFKEHGAALGLRLAGNRAAYGEAYAQKNHGFIGEDGGECAASAALILPRHSHEVSND